MIRLNIVVEGQTEETFVRDVLGPHLLHFDIACFARCAQTGRKRGRRFKGGVVSYAQFRRDLVLWMKEDHKAEAHFSTMVDLYRLPQDFPGYSEGSGSGDVHQRVASLEACFAADVQHHLGQFVPHIQPHEFEALLLSRPALFTRRFPGREEDVQRLVGISASFPSPEDIDDDHPPSKRILAILRDYDKVADGPALAAAIGIDALREKCAHFSNWVATLENLSRTS